MITLRPYILFEKKIYLYFIIGNGQSRKPALCQLYRHTFVPYRDGSDATVGNFFTPTISGGHAVRWHLLAVLVGGIHRVAAVVARSSQRGHTGTTLHPSYCTIRTAQHRPSLARFTALLCIPQPLPFPPIRTPRDTTG